MEIINQEYELVPLAALRPHPKNPRKGDTVTIAESIIHNGFYGVVVAQRSTGFILAGNHRHKAAEQLGVRCYGIEIEPKYVAVILERLSEVGLKPNLLPV